MDTDKIKYAQILVGNVFTTPEDTNVKPTAYTNQWLPIIKGDGGVDLIDRIDMDSKGFDPSEYYQ